VNSQTITARILSPPVLADGFRCLVQPIAVSQQRDQFDGAKEFHRVGFRLAQRPQFARTDENGDIVRRAIQELRHAGAILLAVGFWFDGGLFKLAKWQPKLLFVTLMQLAA
jgi:hypothetical protein